MAARPDDYDCAMKLPFVLAREGRTDEAKAVGWEFAQKHPGTAGAFKARSLLLFTLRDESEKRRRDGGAKSKDAASEETTLAGDRVADLTPLLREAVTKFPDDATIAWYLGWELKRAGDLDGAEPFLVKGALHERIDAGIPAAAAKFLRVDRRDPARALPFYLAAYFIDRNAIDECDPVDFRIRSIAGSEGKDRFDARVAAGEPLETILADGNVVVAAHALGAMHKRWSPKYADALFDVCVRESQSFRMDVAKVLVQHVDASFDERVEKMLKDADPRRRMLAGGLTVWRPGGGTVGLVVPLLYDETELVRIRVVGELLTLGTAEAKAVLKARRDKETCPEIKEMLSKL